MSCSIYLSTLTQNVFVRLFVCLYAKYICIYIFKSIRETWNFNWNDDNLSKQKKYTKSNISMHIKYIYVNNSFFSMRCTEMVCISIFMLQKYLRTRILREQISYNEIDTISTFAIEPCDAFSHSPFDKMEWFLHRCHLNSSSINIVPTEH